MTYFTKEFRSKFRNFRLGSGVLNIEELECVYLQVHMPLNTTVVTFQQLHKQHTNSSAGSSPEEAIPSLIFSFTHKEC